MARESRNFPGRLCGEHPNSRNILILQGFMESFFIVDFKGKCSLNVRIEDLQGP